MTVYGGTQKISMGRNKDTDYKSKLMAATAQAQENAYIQGVQDVMEDGPSNAVRKDRTAYGNSNLPVNEMLQGANSNFSYKDSPGNQPTDDLANQTGSVRTQVSSTNVPQQDPEQMETDALERRLAMMAKGGQGFPGLNDRNQGA